MPFTGIAFDAFGTLFDLSALRPRLDEAAAGRGDELLDALLARLLPATWHLTLADAYRPFPEVAAAVLVTAAQAVGVGLSPERAGELARGLAALPAFGDAAGALDGLRPRPLAVLSNGTEDGIRSLVEGAGLAGRFDHLLAADAVGRFKPAPEVYALAPRAFGAAAPRAVLLVSGNDWDVTGAKLAGLSAAWVARGRVLAPYLGVEPDLVVEELADLPAAVARFEAR